MSRAYGHPGHPRRRTVRVLLVHGAWHGAWAWDPVIGRLRAAGHDVTAIDLPGADGDLTATLGDQVAAVADWLRRPPAGPTVLVAHSHGALVAQEAASLVPDRVAGMVGVDGWFATGTTSFLDLVPDWMSELVEASVAVEGDQPVVPAPPPSMFGIDDAALAASLEPRLRPQPLGTFTGLVSGFRLDEAGIPGVAIVCEPRTLPFDELAVAQGLPVWPITSGHDVMLLHPHRLGTTLARAVETLPGVSTATGRTAC